MKNFLKMLFTIAVVYYLIAIVLLALLSRDDVNNILLSIVGVALLIPYILYNFFKNKRTAKKIFIFEQDIDILKGKISALEHDKNTIQGKLDTKINTLNEIGFPDYEATQKLIADKHIELNKINQEIEKAQALLQEANLKDRELEDKILAAIRKLKRVKELYKSVEYSIKTFLDDDISINLLNADDKEEYDNLAPSVVLKLHHMDIKELRKTFKNNDKDISKILTTYERRYTTKSNKAIYQLMVIGLRAELQNILYNLRYEKLDKSVKDVKVITNKYLKIAGEGNQSIAGTLTRFISEIEYLFVNSVKIEYNYYVKREQARQEQLALREQMRQEAAERKAIELEKKKIEKEELKFITEIDKLKNNLTITRDTKEIDNLNARIQELEAQLSQVTIKKEDIIKLQNGKAGSVYIISNLGSFGENIFKIGMTRRLEPQDRVNELGSASVPFRFDVHSFIFSDNAVDLENTLHQKLNDKRVNKVNLRKEFFKVSIDELEELVNEIDPTAAFNKTMLAEEFRQSLSTDEIYTSDYNYYDDTDEDEEEYGEESNNKE